ASWTTATCSPAASPPRTSAGCSPELSRRHAWRRRGNLADLDRPLRPAAGWGPLVGEHADDEGFRSGGAARDEAGPALTPQGLAHCLIRRPGSASGRRQLEAERRKPCDA